MKSECFSDATEDQAVIIAKPTDIMESAWTVTSFIGFSPSAELNTSTFSPTHGLSLIGQIGTGMTAGIVNGLAAPVGAAVLEQATMILLGTSLAGIAAKVRRCRKANKV